MDEIPIPPGLAAEAERARASPTPARNLAALVAGAAARIPIAELTETAMALRAANPTDRLIWVLTDPLFYTQVPSWHWRMVADRARNRAYERAIRASLTPGMTVLEIGTGAGLLAMMAARAGAGHVFTIEENPLMAETARRTIAANGLAERITVIEASSQAVEVGRELPRPCELLIHEILDVEVLAEGVLPSVAHAREALLVEGAPLLPERLWAAGALSGDPIPGGQGLGDIEGFDLSPLALIGAPGQQLSGARGRHRLSPSLPLLEFDLRESPIRLKGAGRARLVANAQGRATGVEQWLGFAFPCGTRFTSDRSDSHWGSQFHAFGREVAVTPGQGVGLEIGHGRTLLYIGLAGPDSA